MRTAGRTRRLYTNGAFHSAWNPGHLFTGGPWDLLAVAALYGRNLAALPRNALVLGVGGGTAIHQLLRLAPACEITGVDVDETHLDVARRFFALTDPRVTLEHADARDWLSRPGATFDVIVDDVFVHARDDGDPVRPFPADAAWYGLLLARLASGGTLVQNHLGERAARAAARTLPPDRFPHRRVFATPKYENSVLGCYPGWIDASDARRLLYTLAPRNTFSRLRATSRGIPL